MKSKRLVVVRSAYDNAGDHLISEAVSQQLENHGIENVILRRPRKWDSSSHGQFKQALSESSAICLAGGPLLREDLVDGFLDGTLIGELDKVFLYGVGRSSGVNRFGRVNFKRAGEIIFSRETGSALREIMSNGLFHSARDSLTENILNKFADELGWVQNTGCPVRQVSSWPERTISTTSSAPRRLLFTAPAREHRGALTLARKLVQNFEDVRIVFQSGLSSPDPANFTLAHRIVRSPSLIFEKDFNLQLMRIFEKSVNLEGRGQKVIDSRGSKETLKAAVEWADVVIGYRVHAHLYALSQNKKSLLIAEDLRGFGQNLDAMAASRQMSGMSGTSRIEPITIRTPINQVWDQLTRLSSTSSEGSGDFELDGRAAEAHDKFVGQKLLANLTKLGF